MTSLLLWKKYCFFHKKNFVTSVRYVLKLLIPDFHAFLTPIFHLFMSSGCILSAFLMPSVYLELGLTHFLRSYFNNIFSSLMNTSHFYNWYLILFKKNLPFVQYALLLSHEYLHSLLSLIIFYIIYVFFSVLKCYF